MLGLRSSLAIGIVFVCACEASPKTADKKNEPIFETDPNPPAEQTASGSLKPTPSNGSTPSTSRTTKNAPLGSDGGLANSSSVEDSGDAGAMKSNNPTQVCVGFEEREAEPNDAANNATAFIDALCATIDTAGDVDEIVFDSDNDLSAQTFIFMPDSDARITVTSPSGHVASSERGWVTYVSLEKGRFSIRVTSPGGQRQGYVLERL